MNVNHSTELQLLLICCSCNLTEDYRNLEKYISSNEVDWSAFIRLTQYHRVTPVVTKALRKCESSVPGAVLQELALQSLKNLRRMMNLAGELNQLHRLFDDNHIEFISLKGPLMAQQLYGNYSNRQTRDLDILVEESTLDDALSVLMQSGYRLIDLYFCHNPEKRHLYLMRENHVRLHHPEKAIVVELHWALSKYFTCFDTEKIFERAVTAEFMGKSFKTMPLHLQFVFLCTHGIYHQYDSLFWLFDIAWIIKNKNPDFNAVLLEAKKLKCDQVVVSSVFLVHYFFDIPIPESCPKMNRQEQFLFDQCLKNITGSSSSVSHTKSKNIFSILNQRMQWLKYQMLMTSDNQSRKRILFLKMIKPYVWHKTDKIPSNKIAYLLMTQVKWLMMILNGKNTVHGVVKRQKTRKVKE